MKFRLLLAFVPCLLLGEPAAPAIEARVVRGPYLQLGTPESMVVRWRTDQPTTSYVRFGTAPDRLDRTIRATGELTEHVVQLDHLQPATRYYY